MPLSVPKVVFAERIPARAEPAFIPSLSVPSEDELIPSQSHSQGGQRGDLPPGIEPTIPRRVFKEPCPNVYLGGAGQHQPASSRPNPLNQNGPDIPGVIMHSMDRDEVPLLVNSNLEELSDRYLTWLRNDVYLTFEASRVVEEGESSTKCFVRRCAKRGNTEYIKAVRERISDHLSKIPSVVFFNPSRAKRYHRTKCLYFVLTTDPKKVSSRYAAWQNVGKELNRFIAGVRRYLDLNTTRTIRSWECFYQKAEGYPHVNLLLYMDKSVNVRRHTSKPDKHGRKHITYRLFNYKTKEELGKYWSWGFIDIQGISRIGGAEYEEILSSVYGEDSPDHAYNSVFSLAHACKYLTKNVRGEETNDKVVMLNALLWAMRKRTFSMGNFKFPEFADLVSDLTNDMSNSNKNMAIAVTFLGVLPSCVKKCMKSRGRPPPSCPYLDINRPYGRVMSDCPESPDYWEAASLGDSGSSGFDSASSGDLTTTKCIGCGKFVVHPRHDMVLRCDNCLKSPVLGKLVPFSKGPGCPADLSPIDTIMGIIKSGVSGYNDIIGVAREQGIPPATSEYILEKAIQEGRVFCPTPQEVRLV